MTYEINRYDSVPNFITTDAVVHNYHLFILICCKMLNSKP